MKKLVSISLYSIILILSACTAKTHSGHNEADKHEHEHEHDHGDEIILHADDAEKFGVKTMVVKPDTFFETITVSGQVFNSPSQDASIVAPKSGIVTFNKNAVLGGKLVKGQAIGSIKTQGVSGGDTSMAAKARISAAKKELDRMTPLLAEGIITKGQLNAAQAEYDQAVAAYSPAAANGLAETPISGTIISINVKNGEYVEAGQLIATVSENTEITIRTDVPTTARSILNNISGANIRPTGTDSWLTLKDIDGRIGRAPIAPSSGYESVYITSGNNGSLTPGTFVEVVLMGTPRPNVINVPIAAISEQQGSKFVFVKIDEDGYEKIPVTTGASNGINVEILSGLESGKEIVSEGTVFVRLAETSGNVPEGHSHNH